MKNVCKINFLKGLVISVENVPFLIFALILLSILIYLSYSENKSRKKLIHDRNVFFSDSFEVMRRLEEDLKRIANEVEKHEK